jgi:hypothetical protein
MTATKAFTWIESKTALAAPEKPSSVAFMFFLKTADQRNFRSDSDIP